MLTRRQLMTSLAGTAAMAAAPRWAVAATVHPLYGGEIYDPGDGSAAMDALPALAIDPAKLPPPESPIDYPIEPADRSVIPYRFRPQVVEWDQGGDTGTVVVEPENRYLYLVMGNGQAMRYGVGVGRAGFAWSGDAVVGMKRRWPRWVPPPEMTVRDSHAAEWANGMPGGPENPLGARALYLYSNGQDTQYRIHGTNDPKSIGKAMSSGCIRMLNEDVAAIFPMIPVGTRVVVRPSTV
jgi:lipoprotein-anchoring transpeptidase ErfK/SrfK